MTAGSGWLAVGASGRVHCPRRGEEVELTRCLHCNRLLDVDRTAAAPALRCSAVHPAPDRPGARHPDEHVD